MKKISLGSWITLNHPSIVELMCDCGFDWLCIDLEHRQLIVIMSFINFNYTKG